MPVRKKGSMGKLRELKRGNAQDRSPCSVACACSECLDAGDLNKHRVVPTRKPAPLSGRALKRARRESQARRKAGVDPTRYGAKPDTIVKYRTPNGVRLWVASPEVVPNAPPASYVTGRVPDTWVKMAGWPHYEALLTGLGS